VLAEDKSLCAGFLNTSFVIRLSLIFSMLASAVFCLPVAVYFCPHARKFLSAWKEISVRMEIYGDAHGKNFLSV
jgi:hypothetical protein